MPRFNIQMSGRDIDGAARSSGTARRLARMGRIAAVLAVFVGAVAATSSFPLIPSRQSDDTLKTVTAPIGKMTEVSLPDGSTVMLGPGSTLSYAASMATDTKRDVHLDGEAYFNVSPQPDRPFAVRAGTLLADIDAKCTVRAYPEDSYPQLAVQSGQATIGETVIEAGEVGTLAADGTVVVEAADTAAWFSWTHGRLAFTNAFRNAIPKLNRWYDLDLRVADSALGDAVLIATLPDRPFDGTIQAIAFALSARIEQKGRTITFFPAADTLRSFKAGSR